MNLEHVVIVLLALGSSAVVDGATPTFFARRDYPNSGQWIQVADANGDNIPDVLALGGSNITVLFGKGNGALVEGPTSFTGMYAPGRFVAADLNGDGKVDLVISGGVNGISVPGGIDVCFGNGDGTFQSAIFYQTGTDMHIGAVVLGDFNGDGVLDALTDGDSGVWLLTGKGGGAFNAPALTPFSGLTNSTGEIAAADFNGDGKLDVVVTTEAGFAVLLGNGNGTFHSPEYFTAPGLITLAVGDVNLDGHPDIALAAQGSNYVSLYIGDGSGGFAGPTYVYLPAYSLITIGDVNGDGIPDLINGYGYVAIGKGNGKFEQPTYHPVNASELGPHNPVLADLRNNGLMDIVVQGSLAVSVLLAEGKGKFEDGIWTAVSGGHGCGVAADFNGDGNPDFAQGTTLGIQMLLGTAKGSAPFTPGASIALTGALCLMAAGDLNGDGIPDLLAATANPPPSIGGTIYSYLGNGDGTFTLKGTTPLSTLGFFVIGDFNHDGKLDFATDSNLLALGNGDGTFLKPVPYLINPPVCGFEGIAAGDMNNDGWSDLVLACYNTNSIYVLINNRHGGFSQSTIANKDGPQAVVLADVNRDGNLDAIVIDYSAAVAVVYLGDGKGNLTFKSTLGYASPQGTAAVADVNRDGIPDVELLEAGNVGIFLGKGDGTFKQPFYVGTGPAPGDLLLENLHRQSPTDGTPDIVLPDSSGGVTVLLNRTK